MSIPDRFMVWFAVYWMVMIAWRVYFHWRGVRKTEVEWAFANVVEWIVFFILWFQVVR